jgi:hypothetical protein
MIILALNMFLWYFSLAVTSVDSGTFSLMNLARSFSSRMSAILYFHYIRDMVQRKVVHVQYLSRHEHVVDVFTKLLPRRSSSTSLRDLAWWRMPP